MTLKECYEKMNGDYEDALKRFQMERLVEKFLLKFPAEPTVPSLRQAYADGDIEACFAAVHTLKSVAGNLSLTALYDTACELTEQLRSRTEPADPALMQKLNDSYDLIISVIEEYQTQK